MYINIVSNKLTLVFQYNPVIINIIRQLDGRVFNTKTKTWSIPIIHVVKVLDVLTPLGFKASAEVLELYNTKISTDKEIAKIIEGDVSQEKINQVEELQLPLFNFQKKGVYFLAERQSGILGDEPGCGKTVQSLATTLINKAKRNLVVCPSSLKIQWEEEINKWIPAAIVYIVAGTKKQRLKIYQEAQKQTKLFYIIINYELILRDVDELSKF